MEDPLRRLPEDTLCVVFNYLDAYSCMQCQRACGARLQIDPKCGYIALKPGPGPNSNRVGQLTLVGCMSPTEPTGEVPERLKWGKRRTRGHLPQPDVMPDGDAMTEEKPKEVVPRHGNAAAFRIEGSGTRALRSLDLSACTFQQDSPTMRPLRRVVEELDVSGIRTLERLSVRGCGSLRRLLLPPGIFALDTASCSELHTISMPFGVSGRGMTALNLSGCRSLVDHNGHMAGPVTFRHQACLMTAKFMKHIHELDLSCATKLTKTVVAAALLPSTNLISISLRYIATNEIMVALAWSPSASTSLSLVDVAFSRELTDEAVETLVDSAPGLNRLNLRGCSAISAECYNDVPIKLEKRRLENESIKSEQETYARPGGNDRSHKHKRKGDSIFFFASAQALRSKKRGP